MASYGDSPRPYRWPPPWFENFLAKDSGCSASDFVIEAFGAWRAMSLFSCRR